MSNRSFQRAVPFCWLLLLLGCAGEPEVGRTHPALLSMEPYPGEASVRSRSERWYRVRLQGVPAGTVHLSTTLHTTPLGVRRLTVRTEEVAFRRGGRRVRIQAEDWVLSARDGSLLRLTHRERQTPGEESRLEVGRVGAELVSLQGVELAREPFEPGTLGPFGLEGIVLGGQTPVPGVPTCYRVYSLQQRGYARERIEFRVGERPGTWETLHSTEGIPGLWSLQVLDEQGLPSASLSVMGFLRVETEWMEKPPERSPVRAEGPDLTPYLQVATHRPDLDRLRLEWLRVRLVGWPEGVSTTPLRAPGQEVLPGGRPGEVVVVLRHRGEAPGQTAFPPGALPAELAVYLEQTHLAPAGDPAVQALASGLTRGSRDGWEASRRLRRWVSAEIKSSLGISMASAAETLARREGDCSEMAILLATLARAVGIPSRCVFGLVFHQGEFQRHMWTEVWLGRWWPLDAALGADGLTAGWIRFGEVPLGLQERERTGARTDALLAAPLRTVVEGAEMK